LVAIARIFQKIRTTVSGLDPTGFGITNSQKKYRIFGKGRFEMGAPLKKNQI
jgi:hypothetical protein